MRAAAPKREESCGVAANALLRMFAGATTDSAGATFAPASRPTAFAFIRSDSGVRLRS
jgi:hypothetical protein